MANRDSKATHQVYTPIETPHGLIQFRLGYGVQNAKGEVEITLIGSPINGKLVLVPIQAPPAKR